jgi:hypothetical protein
MPRRTGLVTAFIALATYASAKKVGFFESSICPDPQGFESCYKTAYETWAACVSDNCADQDSDCVNLCTCIENLDKLDCAGQSCWNQVTIVPGTNSLKPADKLAAGLQLCIPGDCRRADVQLPGSQI